MAHLKIRIYLILVIAVIITISGCISTLEYPRELHRSERYHLSIETGAPLGNATFCVLLPVKNNSPTIGDRSLSTDNFMKQDFSIAFTRTPPGRNLTGPHPGEYSPEGNEPWYLMVHADSWPNGTIEWDVSNVGERYIPSPLFFFNTAFPIGNESILLPKMEFSPPNPKVLKRYADSGSLVYDVPPYSGTQSTTAYAFYRNPFHASVTVVIFIEGMNSWKDVDDTNPGNYYNDYVSGSIKNEEGWNKLTGTFTVAQGEYPDLTSPRWQRIIQENQSSPEL